MWSVFRGTVRTSSVRGMFGPNKIQCLLKCSGGTNFGKLPNNNWNLIPGLRSCSGCPRLVRIRRSDRNLKEERNDMDEECGLGENQGLRSVE